MSKFIAYIKDCQTELMQKVSWPTWNELQSSAIVVLIATLIFGFLIFGIDSIFQGLLHLVYNLFS